VSGSGHGHSHGTASARAGARHLGRLWWAFGLIGVFFVVEVVGGLVTNSLALLSDAAHMLTDLVGLGMALAAIHVANRPSARTDRTFGLYRLEILAALANAVLLLGVGVYVLVEAIVRLRNPESIEGGLMLALAVLGLIVNVIAMLLLRDGASESLNVKGAYLEVLADLLASVGVVVAALIVGLTGWNYADPIIAGLIGVFIFPRTVKLGAQAVRVLVQAAPPNIDVDEMRHDLELLAGVVDVHDLHVWTLTSDMEVASAHLMVAAGTDTHAVLDQARELLGASYGVHHATLQIEPDDHRGCEDVNW
jgi:cobalt-zinc-cadmium efflux system protein